MASKISGDLADYEWHVWAALQFHCDECGEHLECTNDIRAGEEEAPEGPWAWRKAREAMVAGWYLPGKGSSASLGCLCPRCAAKHDAVVQKPKA
jgi:hypothetical protein